jgi:hypothetical protein
MYVVKVYGVVEAAKFAAELVRQGVCFEATNSSNEDVFTFTFSGGF